MTFSVFLEILISFESWVNEYFHTGVQVFELETANSFKLLYEGPILGSWNLKLVLLKAKFY